MKCLMLVFLFTICASCCKSQLRGEATGSYQFRDTIFNFVFDSLNNDLGEVEPVNVNNRMVKHFIYLGDEPAIISGQKTSDPHFICDYPKEPIRKGKVYSFTVCFWFQNGRGNFNKTMALELSDGRMIPFKFKGRFKEPK